jgi:carbohydrate kinase (thermoresistant glucokinase family)
MSNPSADRFAVLVIMGVSGCGKTTIAELLSRELGWAYRDGDEFHPKSNVEKMHSGTPLTDDDRWPWLEAIAAWIDERRNAGEHGIVTCSALKKSYREILIGERKDVGLIYLKGTEDLIAQRLSKRKDHFMPKGLLRSQFQTLEEPGASEHPITVSIEPTPEEIVAAILSELNSRPSS